MSRVVIPVRGMRDLYGEDVTLRQRLIQTAQEVFQTAGAIPVETPVLEQKKVVKNLYGENFNKEVFWVENFDEPDETETEKETSNPDTSGEGEKKTKPKPEPLLMKYDLTAPGARFIGGTGRTVLRKYQIQKVYRRDQPNLTQGRFREFYQCDFDIYGNDNGSGIYDFEILEVMVRLLEKMIGENSFSIKLNDRSIVVEILKNCDVPKKMIPTVTSTLDKLDKKTTDEIRDELLGKRLKPESTANVMLMISDLQEWKLTPEKFFAGNKYFSPPEQLRKVWIMLERVGLAKYFELDPLLARGLDYYTGIIYEASYNDKETLRTTIASGGRYDNMVGKFSTKGKIPAVGLSIGLERIAQILKPKPSLEAKYDVYVASAGKFNKDKYDPVVERLVMVTMLRRAGLRVTFSTARNPKFGTQLQAVFQANIPVMVVIGEREIESRNFNLKDIRKEVQTSVPVDELVTKIREIIEA